MPLNINVIKDKILSENWFVLRNMTYELTRGDGSEDIFVHMETLRRFGITELRPGQRVLVRYGDGPKGKMVAEIRPVQPGGIPSSH